MKKIYIIILIIIAVMLLISLILGSLATDNINYPEVAIEDMKKTLDMCLKEVARYEVNASADKPVLLDDPCKKIIEYEKNCNWECFDKKDYDYFSRQGFLLRLWEKREPNFREKNTYLNLFLGQVFLLSLLTIIISPIVLVVAKTKRKKIDPNSEEYKKYSKRIYLAQKLIKIAAIVFMFCILALAIVNFQISGPLYSEGANV